MSSHFFLVDTHCPAALYAGRKMHDSKSHLMFVQVRQAPKKKKKKCQLAVKLPPCSGPNPPNACSHPALLPAPLFPFFSFYDLPLFCLWTIQTGSHVPPAHTSSHALKGWAGLRARTLNRSSCSSGVCKKKNTLRSDPPFRTRLAELRNWGYVDG